MAEQASITEAQANLSALVDKVAQGRKRVVLTSHGRPRAALVSVRDLEKLEPTPASGVSEQRPKRQVDWLEELDQLIERQRRDRGDVPMTPSVEDLYAIRDGKE